MIGGEEILAQRKNIQALSDDTSSLLKQNVYQNYTQASVHYDKNILNVSSLANR